MFAASCQPPPWAFWFMSKGDFGGRGRRSHWSGPPPWVVELMGHRQQRAERGEVRYLILDAVADQARHGYEIIQVIEERTKGAYRPSPGTIYPTLQMLEEMGHVKGTDQEGRRVYAITEAGKAELAAHREEVEEAYERLGGADDWFEAPEIHELFRRFRRLIRGLARTVRRGGLRRKDLAEVTRIIDEAIERIERVLGGDPSQEA